MNVRTVALLAAWASIAVRAAPAIAQGPPAPSTGQVELEVKGCPAVPTDSVRRVVSIEIGDLLVDTADADEQEVDRLIIRCAGNFAFVEATGSSGGAAHRADRPCGRFSWRRGATRPGAPGGGVARGAQRGRPRAYPAAPEDVPTCRAVPWPRRRPAPRGPGARCASGRRGCGGPSWPTTAHLLSVAACRPARPR